MADDILQLQSELAALRTTLEALEQRVNALASNEAAPTSDAESEASNENGAFWRLAEQQRAFLGDDPRVIVFNLRGLCITGGQIWTHATGFCGLGALDPAQPIFFVPAPDVEANRSLPEETIEQLFLGVASRQRIALLRALDGVEPKTSALLKQATGLTDGQFYHHIRDLFASGCVTKEAQDRYRISERGKILLVVGEALTATLAGGSA